MKNTIYIVIPTIVGYTLAPIIRDTLNSEFVFYFEEVLFILFASPYCMVRYLIVAHKFLPEWYAITTYMGLSIWLISLWIKSSNTTSSSVKMLVAFIGGLIWNLGFHESGGYFLSA